MDREVAEGLRLGTVLTVVAATLVIGTLIFWYARYYGGEFYDKASMQNEQIKTLVLNSLSSDDITDMPLASIYTITAREWRAVNSVSVFDKDGIHITTGTADEKMWSLTPELHTADGSNVQQTASPEQVLYAASGGLYSSKLSGRCYVTVTQDANTLAYDIQVKLQQ